MELCELSFEHCRSNASSTCSTGELCPVLIPVAPAASGKEEAEAESINRDFKLQFLSQVKGTLDDFHLSFCLGIDGYYWDVFNVHT